MTMIPLPRSTTLLERFGAFVAERYPFAARIAIESFEQILAPIAAPGRDPAAIDALREPLRAQLARRFEELHRIQSATTGAAMILGETTPGVEAGRRLAQARSDLLATCDGFLRRESISATLAPEERREILRGMIVTRAVDNRLKSFFTGGEVRWGSASFQGKGFRSLGQEAIYAAAIRLRRGERWVGTDGRWNGDVIAPIIRDLGAALAMRPGRETIRMVLSAQMAKSGPPMNGKDLHIGDLGHGIIPAAAPLTISTMTAAGMAFGFQLQGSDRVAISFIGEGGSSLGEWHEAINLSAVRKLPIVFCLENNQTALSTPVEDQAAVRVFAEKATGYGIPGITVDGTDADAVAAAFIWAVDRARRGEGPALLELISMRMCGHAHHDDMLYLGRDPQPSFDYPPLTDQGYANPELYAYWSRKDPIESYAVRLQSEGIVKTGEVAEWKIEAEMLVEGEAEKVIAASWPEPSEVGKGVVSGPATRTRVEVFERADEIPDELPRVEEGPAHDPKGSTFLEAVMMGVGDALRGDPRVFVYGEDVGGKYGNAFLMLRPLLPEFGKRIINSPISEGGVLGVCVGAALAGMRPIGEMQFNDFVATGFNQLVNNAAKVRYRFGESVPMVVRMPWGGLRYAGPYHSQNTEAWFYRTPGLKIVVPSTPHDARALMAAAVADPDPVLYYEHIALYRDPRVRQKLDEQPGSVPIGKAALRRQGDDLAIISYGAYTHVAMRAAAKLAGQGIEASVLDLRTLSPLDRPAILALARHCNRVLIVHEDTRTGGIGESVAAIVQEEAFEWLDAPVRILGALDTPVPYSPPLEQAFLVSEDEVVRAAELLARY